MSHTLIDSLRRGAGPDEPVTVYLTEAGREAADRMSPADWREVVPGSSVSVVPGHGVSVHGGDPSAPDLVRALFGREAVRVGPPPRPDDSPIHVLIASIRDAVAQYDLSDDHRPHDAVSDCVRCNAAAAVFVPGDPRRLPPRRSRRRA